MKNKMRTINPRLGPNRDISKEPATLSEKTARRALAQAMIALGRSDNPQKAFVENQDVILTALVLLGRGEEAKELASTYGVCATNLPHLEASSE